MTVSNDLKVPCDIYNVHKKVYIAAPIDRVFEAITDSKHWDRYFTTGMELDPQPGGVCNFRWENFGPDLTTRRTPGRVVEIDPPGKFAFQWGSPGNETRAQLTLRTEGDGTILSLFEDDYRQTREGLNLILECSAHWGELLALIKFYVESGITYQSPVSRNNSVGEERQR